MNTRQISGRRSRSEGEYFEKMIEASMRQYREDGLAYIEKTPEPMKPLKPIEAGRFIACYTKSGQPDFKGTLLGGYSVVIEAKHTNSDRIEASRLTEEQYQSLKEHAALGAKAYIVVSFRLESFYRIPWEVWEKMQTIYGHKHIKESELGPEYKLRMKKGVIDFLEGLTDEHTQK